MGAPGLALGMRSLRPPCAAFGAASSSYMRGTWYVAVEGLSSGSPGCDEQGAISLLLNHPDRSDGKILMPLWC